MNEYDIPLRATPSHIEALCTQIRADEKLEKMTDKEIAKLLWEHVGARISMLSLEYSLIEQAIERLGGLDESEVSK